MRILPLLLCWLLLPLAALAQEDDRGFLTRLIEDNLSGAGREVRIEGFQGALSTRASLARLTIADDRGIWLTLNGVVLDWSRSALLAGRLSVSELSAKEILLDRLPEAEPSGAPSPEATDFALPELPVSVEIGRVVAERLVLGPPVLGSEVTARIEASASLAGGEGEARILAQRIDGTRGELQLQAGYGNESRILAIDLGLAEAANGIAARLLSLPGAPPLELSVKGTGPITDYAADIRLATSGVDRLTGRVTLAGDAAQGRSFTARLGGDPTPLFLPDYAAFFGPDVRLDLAGARAPDGRLDLERLLVETQALRLQGRLALAADGLPERIALQGTIAAADGQPVLLPVATTTRVGRVGLRVDYDAAAGESWSARAEVSDLDRPDFDATSLTLDGSGRIARGGGAPSVEGALTYAARGLRPADAALATALGPEVAGRARFGWTRGAELSLPEVTLEGADYGLQARLALDGIGRGLGLKGTATVRADALDRFSGLAGRPLRGRATATVDGSVALLGGRFDAEAAIEGTDLAVGQPELDSLLAGASRVTVSAARDPEGTRLRDLRITARTLSATASGTIASAGSDIVAQLDVTDLSALGPAYRGRLDATARFTGTPDAGRISLGGEGTGIGIGQAEADALLRGASRVEVEAGLSGRALTLDRAEVTTQTLKLSATGRLGAEGSDLAITLASPDLSPLGGGFAGALDARVAFIGTPGNGRITAEATARNLAVGQATANRILAGESRLSAAVRLDRGRVLVDKAQIRNPQLALDARATEGGAGRGFALDGRLANLALVAPQFPGPLTVRGTAIEGAEGYRIDVRAQGPGQIDLRLAGAAAPNGSSVNLTAAGTGQAALVAPFIAPRSIEGPVRFDLRLNGRPELQALSGRASLSGGRFADPGLGLAIEGIAATADLAGGRAQVTAAGRPSSGGQIGVTGGIGLSSPFPADLVATIQRAVLRDPNLYQTTASGRVTINGPLAGGATIAGRIDLDETELRIPSTGFGGASGLDSLRHRNEPAAVRATRARAGQTEGGGAGGAAGGTTRRPYPLDLTINAPQQIFVRGRGLDAELGGALRLTGTTANVVPAGSFELIRGRLDILGKRLVLDEARLLLEGDFVPYLSVRASTENDGIVTSVVIEGRATEPEVSFTSQPELPQEEVLARLLLGRGLDTISPLQAAQLANAVATLAGRGGEGVIGQLRQGFGLDDLDVATDAEGGTSVRAGKYLTENVYTQFEVDQQGGSRINLNLDLRKNLTLRGSAGSDGNTSIGIFLERDY